MHAGAELGKAAQHTTHLQHVKILQSLCNPEGLHAVIRACVDLVDIGMGAIAILHTAVFVNGLEHVPTPLTVNGVASQLMEDEQ